MTPERLVIAYVPVIHRGYLEFFEKTVRPDTIIGILGEWIFDIGELGYLRKDIRRLDALSIVSTLDALVPSAQLVMPIKTAQAFLELDPQELVMPNDHVSRVLQDVYAPWFAERKTRFEPVFLMWDKMSTKVQYEAEPDRTVRLTDPEGQWMARAKGEETKSSDWWRHVGAVAVRDGVELIAAHNEHFPTEHAPYEDGDPRGSSHRGVDLDKTTAGHGEALVIARAHPKGICLLGADLHVGVFPCPTCAISIANAGFRRLYYSGGYSMISAAPILKSKDIEIIRVVE